MWVIIFWTLRYKRISYVYCKSLINYATKVNNFVQKKMPLKKDIIQYKLVSTTNKIKE